MNSDQKYQQHHFTTSEPGRVAPVTPHIRIYLLTAKMNIYHIYLWAK